MSEKKDELSLEELRRVAGGIADKECLPGDLVGMTKAEFMASALSGPNEVLKQHADAIAALLEQKDGEREKLSSGELTTEERAQHESLMNGYQDALRKEEVALKEAMDSLTRASQVAENFWNAAHDSAAAVTKNLKS